MVKTVKKTMAKKKKEIKAVTRGRVYIKSTFNNTIVSIADENGNVISWASSGALGFKGARKSTPFAAQQAMQSAMEKAKVFGLREVSIYITGVGPGREQAVRSLIGSNINVLDVKDVTPIAHGGCRPKKPRRV